jgi:hypothetical protein
MRTIIVVIAALWFVSFANASDSERAITAQMSARYDFTALTSFVRQIIRDHPRFQEVSLARSKVGPEWRFENIDPPRRMRSGDWVIWDRKDEEESFDLYYTFSETHSITARARRLARDRFELVGLSIEEWISLR